ncbi:MAG: TRAP transporter small permease subunit [Chromatiales bacterium]|jgi:TRAP-type C4-dicarboxylate transport system permease small subunit|nr:TRAP transporter small permease subunit [Chromatiales bacterium]
MDGFLEFSHRVKALISSVLGTITVVMLLILTGFSLLEIVRRYIFGSAYEWGNDALVLGMIATVSLYFCVTQTRRSHLVMNAILQLLQSRGFLKTVGLLNILVSAIVVVFCFAIGITGWSTLDYSIARDLRSYSLIVPLWPFFLTMMVGFLLMGLVAFLQLIEDIISYKRKEYLDAEVELITDV